MAIISYTDARFVAVADVRNERRELIKSTVDQALPETTTAPCTRATSSCSTARTSTVC